MSVPGIGPIISSAMTAAISAGDMFSKGRDLAAWPGFIASRMLSGSKPAPKANPAIHEIAGFLPTWLRGGATTDTDIR